MAVQLTVNGERRVADVADDATLLAVLRDDFGLTASRYGCGHGVCGACFVLVDGAPTAACTTKVAGVAGRTILTVEGLADGDRLHPVQQAFLEEDAMQCGYCTSGMLISAAALLARQPRPTEAEVREALQPHLCRCGVYVRAIRAVLKAAGT
jgi:aerobic-type carbon monoxide dehydrogenase small subunit (CoxS/CutS family)